MHFGNGIAASQHEEFRMYHLRVQNYAGFLRRVLHTGSFRWRGFDREGPKPGLFGAIYVLASW